MYAENLQIFKDTLILCKKLMGGSKNVPKLIRFGQYGVAISKSCQALDLIRRINSSFEYREYYLNEFVMLIADVSARIMLFSDAKFIGVKFATELNNQINKVSAMAYGWLNSECKRKGESYRATAR